MARSKPSVASRARRKKLLAKSKGFRGRSSTNFRIAKERQIKVIERHILPEEMSRFSECFLTGSAAEVTPVREIGPYTFTPGTLTEQLMTAYADEVRGVVAPKVKLDSVI